MLAVTFALEYDQRDDLDSVINSTILNNMKQEGKQQPQYR